MKRDMVDGIIIPESKVKELNADKELNNLLEQNINIYTVGDFEEWSDVDDIDTQAFIMTKINSIKIEDLLDRPVINIDTENVRQTIQGKIVMVTGAAGSIGSELVRQIIPYGPEAVILYEMAESPLHDLTLDLKAQFPNQKLVPRIGDVRNEERIEEVMKEYNPTVIYHAAAYKHVPLMEDHPNEAICANVLGSMNMANMAVKYGAERFVMVSTDKAVNPTNVMGCSKRLAEIYVQSLAKQQTKTKFITTRFGNVLGSNGSVIPYFKKQIAAGGPVTVTHPEIIRYFMTIPEACTLVMEASTLGNGGEIFVFDMGKPVKILDLAKNMIRLAGLVPGKDIEIEFTGLRPGEKLFEELLNQKETTLPTQNEKIMVAKVREYEYKQVKKDILELIALAQGNKPFVTVQKMKDIVPEFKSKNSPYERLDKE
ncbi:MAG: polysaccharide biosynthesis protein [Bacteroidaceae bacterium]|nr:polysaccharide biosynthesis protein [Bacteroidaceae bacterium]